MPPVRSVLALVLAALWLPAPGASAATVVVRAGAAAHGRLTFELHGIRPDTLRAARLRAGAHRRSVSLRSVRAALGSGRLRVRAPRWARRPVLVLTTSCGSVRTGYGRLVLGTRGLRAYFRLGERSGATACELAAGGSGTYGGGVSLGRPGALAGDPDASAGLAGGGWVRVGSRPALSPGRALSLEAWVRPSPSIGSETVIGKDGQYLLGLEDRRVMLRIRSSSGAYELTSPEPLRSGAFQHVVGVFDGGALRIYVDGRQVAAAPASGRVLAGSRALYIGASLGLYDFLWGAVDEVAVYGSALPARAVSRHFGAGAARSLTPDASPTADGGDVSCGFGGFAAGRWPEACWRAYGPESPFNQPLPSEPRLAPDSAAVVARLMSFGPIDHLVAGEADTPDDYWHPTYYSQPTDPLYTLHCYESSWGTCAIEGDEIRVPDAARPAAGGDAHMTVVDQAGGWEYDLYKVRSKPTGGGTLVLRWGGRIRIYGDGLASGATAAGFGTLAGIIRAPELTAGHIDHALFMVANCDAGRFVYPAAKGGRSCAALGLATSDAPPMGARLQLAMTPEQIDALPVPAWKKTILRAMATYGMILGDTGGGSWGIQAESGSTYTSFGYPDPFVVFAQANDWTPYNGRYVANLRSDVDWARYLRVIDPCVSERTC